MIYPTLRFEKKLWQRGYYRVCGLDEVGRGSFAGPVVAGAVIFPKNTKLPQGITDSKLLRPKTRERLSEEIKKIALGWSIAEIGVPTINQKGVGRATQMAFRKVLKSLQIPADFVLVDAFDVKHLNRKRQRAIKHGDRECISIAAASIVAKVYRDKLMKKLHKKYPQYDFSKNKGYGTKEHQEAIKKYGLSKVHRKSFNLTKFLA